MCSFANLHPNARVTISPVVATAVAATLLGGEPDMTRLLLASAAALGLMTAVATAQASETIITTAPAPTVVVPSQPDTRSTTHDEEVGRPDGSVGYSRARTNGATRTTSEMTATGSRAAAAGDNQQHYHHHDTVSRLQRRPPIGARRNGGCRDDAPAAGVQPRPRRRVIAARAALVPRCRLAQPPDNSASSSVSPPLRWVGWPARTHAKYSQQQDASRQAIDAAGREHLSRALRGSSGTTADR